MNPVITSEEASPPLTIDLFTPPLVSPQEFAFLNSVA